MTVLDLRDILVEYPARGRGTTGPRDTMRAVNRVDLSIGLRETVGLVGESGSGKSTLGRVAMCLLRPTDGRVSFLDTRIDRLSDAALRPIRAQMGIVFQDPYASLNPRQRVETIVALPFRVHTTERGPALRRKILDLLDRVGLTPADEFATKFPHQLSGGQRQRVAIARAIALRPRLVVADEPVSSLDVSVGAQILDLLRELQHDLGVSYLFISHDLAVVHTIAHRVAVMYRGEIVEEGPGSDVLLRAAHPYTHLLVGSIPQLLGTTGRLPLTSIQRPGAAPTACPFQPRCPHAMSRCAEESPPPAHVGGAPTHRVRCFAVTMGTPPMTWVASRAALSQRLISGR